MDLQKAFFAQISPNFHCTHSLEDNFISSEVFVSLSLYFTYLVVLGNIRFT